MLGTAVITLQTHKTQIRRSLDLLSQSSHFVYRDRAAASHSNVDFDINIHFDLASTRCLRKLCDLFRVIHQHANRRPRRHIEHMTYLFCTHDLISDQHILNSGFDKAGGLADLLTTNSDRALLNLT